MNLLLPEILQRVSNAKTKAEKVKILQEHNSPALRAILIWNFDHTVKSALPEGSVPYKPLDVPEGTIHTQLSTEYRTLYNYVVGGNNEISDNKRQTLFIQLLESLHPSEAELLCLVKDKELQSKYRITKAVVEEAFSSIKWGGRGN